MTDEELHASVMKQKGVQILEDAITGKPIIKKIGEDDMSSTMLSKEHLEKKKVTNIKDNIQMTVVDGKLTVLNMVTFDLVATEAEVTETSFFAQVESKNDERLECVAHVIYSETEKAVSIFHSTKWLDGTSSPFNIDRYPEEMAEVISKSISSNRDIIGKYKKNFIVSKETAPLLQSDLNKSMDMCESAYNDLIKEIKKFKAMDCVDIDSFLDRYEFKKHLLIQGEKGGGKTYAVDKLIRDKGYDSEFIAGHEGIESIDLLGYYVKNSDGNLVWLDGVLTRAFRKAKDKPTVLFFDETLRVPARELNILVGCLTPSSAKTYRLRTNRIVNEETGIGETEVLEIPMENLWCIGTTNVGAGYQVDEIDHALADRFRVVNKETTPSDLEAILESCADDSGIDKSVIPKMITFYTQMRDLVDGGELEKYVNARHMCEVIQLAEDVSEVVSYVIDLIPTWTSQDTNGKPNKAEKDIIGKLIKKTFK